MPDIHYDFDNPVKMDTKQVEACGRLTGQLGLVYTNCITNRPVEVPLEFTKLVNSDLDPFVHRFRVGPDWLKLCDSQCWVPPDQAGQIVFENCAAQGKRQFSKQEAEQVASQILRIGKVNNCGEFERLPFFGRPGGFFVVECEDYTKLSLLGENGPFFINLVIFPR